MCLVGELQSVDNRVRQRIMFRTFQRAFTSFLRNLFCILHRFRNINSEGRMSSGGNYVSSISAAFHAVKEDFR